MIRETVGCEWSSICMIDHSTKTLTQLYAENVANTNKNNSPDIETVSSNVRPKPKHIKIKGFDKGVLGYIATSGKIVRNNTPSKKSKKQLQFEEQVQIYDNSHANCHALNEYNHAISQASDKLSNSSQHFHPRPEIVPTTQNRNSNSSQNPVNHLPQESSYVITVGNSTLKQNDDSQSDKRITNSVTRNGVDITGFLCVPILNDTNEVIGIVATANKLVQTPFTHLDIEMLQTLAIEIAQILQRFATKILLSSIDNQDSFAYSMLDMYQPHYGNDTTNTATAEMETPHDGKCTVQYVFFLLLIIL